MKSLKGRILILLILLNLLINFVNIENAYAVSYAGGSEDVYVPTPSGAIADWYRKPIAFGYRVTLMKFSGATMVSGTHSVNYWDPHNMNNIESAADEATLKERNGIFNIILPKQLQTISNVQTIYLVDETYSTYNKQDFILNNGRNYNSGYNHAMPCKASEGDGGNCITYDLQQKLISDYFSVNNLTATIITDENKKNLGRLARDCGYNKSSNDLENFNYMVNDNEDIVVQIEPLSAVKIVNNDDSRKYFVRVGTSYELALTETFTDFTMKAGVYANPVIYAKKNGDGVSIVSGINLTTSQPETKKGNLTHEGSLGASLFRLKDYFLGNCAEEFNANKFNISNNDAIRHQFLADNGISNVYTSVGISPLSDWGKKIFKYADRDTGAKVCNPKSCNEIAQYIYMNYYGTEHYEEYINQLYQYEFDLGHTYNTLQTGVWKDLVMSGPSCGTSPSCSPSKTIDCNDDIIRNLIVADTTSYNCWYTNETAYTGQASYSQILQAKDSCTDGNTTCTNRPTNCELICRQQVTFEFPGNIKSKVKAGMVFKWGTDRNKTSDLFGNMQVKMTCKIKSTDGNAANCRQQNRKHLKDDSGNDKCTHSYTDSDTSKTCYAGETSRQVDNTSSCKTEEPEKNEDGTDNPNYPGCKEYNKKTVYSCTQVHSFDWKTWVAADGYVNNTVNYMPDLANELGTEDNITTDVKVDYTLRYNISDTLKREYVSAGSKNNGAQITCSTTAGNSCSITTGSISTTTQDVIANYSYKYTDTFNWYSSKINGELYDKSNYTSMTSHDDKKEAMYYHIGYSMPTSFKTHSKFYADTLKATVSKVGYGNHFDNLLGTGSSFVYSCGIKIHNELYDYECYDDDGDLIDNAPDYCSSSEDPKGLDVVFREIQLIKDKNKIYLAFPGALASNSDLNPREKGRNWGKLTDDEIVKILDPIVYSKEPMYKIKLNTSKIFEIRKYNKKAKDAHKDPYAGMYEYSSVNGDASGFVGYICKEESGSKYCASSLLSKLASGSGESQLTGSCMSSNDTHRRANDIAKGLVLNCKNE